VVVARVSHLDPRCPVCSAGTLGIVTTGAVVPPPFPNPEYKPKSERSQGGQHGHLWFHGTHFSPEEDDENEKDPVVQDAGGRLKTPEWDSESGSRSEEHWNTDLGVHFTSLHHVAKDLFAKPQNGDIDSRVAHATLHMQNPKRFDSEHDMTHEAIDWAQNNGLHYLPQHHRAHEEFENGHYDGVADHDKSGIWHEVNPTSMPRMREQREAISHIDRHGPSWEEGDPNEGDKEKYLATHPQRATLTEGYRQHLQSQGHDGVVYGNEHEGPQGHASAIAFPETPVAIHKWEWFHPEHGRPADAQESAERARMAPSNRQLKLFGAKDETPISFRYDERDNGGMKWPTSATLTAQHPEHGDVGFLKYRLPRRAKDKIQIDRLEVPEEHQGNGYGSQLMDELQNRHSKTPIDHGDRTDDGKAWWKGYTRGKSVQKGRTIASVIPVSQGYTYRQTVQGPNGYEDRENTVEGPLYHGGRANLAPGDHLTTGRKPNSWGDDSGKSTHNYFTRNPDTAFSYAQQVGRRGRVYEVEPTGEFSMDHSEDDFKTKHPLRVRREVPREEWPDWAKKASKTAASGWNFEHFRTEGQHWRSFGGPPESPRQHALEYKVRPEGTVEFPQSSMNDFYAKKSGPEVHARMRQNALEHHDTTEHDPASEKPAEPPKAARRTYYHGTTVPDVTHILPAAQHGKGVVFHSDTSPEHAYASTDLKDAWNYAQKAYDHKMNGRPRVYQVRPIGGHKNVEKDPEWDDVTGRHRGNNESDFRSKHGFEVVREMKPPKHMRDSYTDNEWGED
jgi:predicted GNAT family acetyltransferase